MALLFLFLLSRSLSLFLCASHASHSISSLMLSGSHWCVLAISTHTHMSSFSSHPVVAHQAALYVFVDHPSVYSFSTDLFSFPDCHFPRFEGHDTSLVRAFRARPSSRWADIGHSTWSGGDSMRMPTSFHAVVAAKACTMPASNKEEAAILSLTV